MTWSPWPHRPLSATQLVCFVAWEKYNCDHQVNLHFLQHQALPAISRWYFGSLWKRLEQSLFEQRCGLITASSWLFSAQCCVTSGRGCWLGCPGQQEWLWPGSWLQKRQTTRESTTFRAAGYGFWSSAATGPNFFFHAYNKASMYGLVKTERELNL